MVTPACALCFVAPKGLAVNGCTSCKGFFCGQHIRTTFDDGSQLCSSCFQKQFDFSEPMVVACAEQQQRQPQPQKLDLFEKPVMTYAKAKKQKFPGQQREHGIPNSSFIKGKGRKGPTIYGAEEYTEDSALVFPVGDDQKAGTEHRFLTDYERAIDRSLHESGQYMTLGQKLRAMQPAWEMAMLEFCSYNGKSGGFTPAEEQQRRVDAEEAAFALKEKFREHFEEMDVEEDLHLKNGLHPKSAQPPKVVPKKQQFDNF